MQRVRAMQEKITSSKGNGFLQKRQEMKFSHTERGTLGPSQDISFHAPSCDSVFCSCLLCNSFSHPPTPLCQSNKFHVAV